MRAAPPRMLEALVGVLLPRACREHVLGDLHERYTSAPRYLGEAASVVPLVLLSRVRRAADGQLLAMEAFALYLSFVAAAWRLDGKAFLYEQQGFLRLAIPAAAALAVLLLAGAYGAKPVVEGALCGAAACLSQAAVLAAAPELLVPRWTLISGAGLGMLLVSALRILFPAQSGRPYA